MVSRKPTVTWPVKSYIDAVDQRIEIPFELVQFVDGADPDEENIVQELAERPGRELADLYMVEIGQFRCVLLAHGSATRL